MKNDNLHLNNPRGSSPPFHDPENELLKWLSDLKSIGQRDERSSANRIAGRPERGEKINGDQDDRPVRDGGQDETRWQNDGGKGGDIV